MIDFIVSRQERHCNRKEADLMDAYHKPDKKQILRDRIRWREQEIYRIYANIDNRPFMAAPKSITRVEWLVNEIVLLQRQLEALEKKTKEKTEQKRDAATAP